MRMQLNCLYESSVFCKRDTRTIRFLKESQSRINETYI